MVYYGGDYMAKKDKAKNDIISETRDLQLKETQRLLEKAKEIDPLDDNYITIQERISDSNESSEKIEGLKEKKKSKLEIAEKLVTIGVGISGIALTGKECFGGMIRNDCTKTILRNVVGWATKFKK
jgi:hypothetical protein